MLRAIENGSLLIFAHVRDEPGLSYSQSSSRCHSVSRARSLKHPVPRRRDGHIVTALAGVAGVRVFQFTKYRI